MNRKSRAGVILLGLPLLIVLFSQNAQADLVLPVISVDNPLQFAGTLEVTQFTQATYTFSSSNWRVTVREDFIGSEAIPNDFEVTAQHLVGPNPGDVAPNPMVLSMVLFANSPTPGGPQRGPFLFSVTHAPSDTDYLQVTYVPIGAGQSRLIVQASHGALPSPVPEPSTILLLSSGIGGAVLFSNKYKVLRRSCSG